MLARQRVRNPLLRSLLAVFDNARVLMLRQRHAVSISEAGTGLDPVEGVLSERLSELQRVICSPHGSQHPKMSGGILGVGVLLYVLTSLRGYSYIALVSIVLLMHLFITIATVQVQVGAHCSTKHI